MTKVKISRCGAYLIDKLLLEGAVFTDMTHDLPDLWALLNGLEGVTAAHGLTHTLCATLCVMPKRLASCPAGTANAHSTDWDICKGASMLFCH